MRRFDFFELDDFARFGAWRASGAFGAVGHPEIVPWALRQRDPTRLVEWGPTTCRLSANPKPNQRGLLS
jgi:hypothetical protein